MVKDYMLMCLYFIWKTKGKKIYIKHFVNIVLL